ncbi:MAG TPA: Gfo/Idh/MocA family oxidoreductase [Candidatus Hydrogenedentes bacterium]|nr:Gfo/Idh/MocA family oxidoreductase [Candidatus Hydrogenedentota bacterium]HPG65469.1 Gfo/Idh/MocA family oxidoreductase [Candidatus Hydrogenedentota bacterium]
MPRIGYGIIGCGTIAPYHAEAIAGVRNAQLRAVADVYEPNAQKMAQRFSVDRYTDYRAMLERDDIQAVTLCVPSGLRAEMVVDCAKAGKHVLAEKPLDVTTQRIDRLIAAADKAGILLGCIFQNRFAEGPRRLRQAIEQGRFGKLVLGDAYVKWYRTQAYYASGAWRGTRKLDGGGALMNQGVHQVDLLVWFMGDVKQVRAKTALVGHEGLEVEDLACAMLEFENGAMGAIEASTACWPGHEARIEILGTDGSAILEDGELRYWKFRKRKAVDAKVEASLREEAVLGSGAGDPTSNLKSEGHRRQIQDFTEAILRDRAPFVDGREGRRAVALIEAIYQSAAKGGKPVAPGSR